MALLEGTWSNQAPRVAESEDVQQGLRNPSVQEGRTNIELTESQSDLSVDAYTEPFDAVCPLPLLSVRGRKPRVGLNETAAPNAELEQGTRMTRTKRMLCIASMGLCLAVAVLSLAGSALGEGLRLVEHHGDAAKYTTSDAIYPVLVLRGSWEEMGRQYGALAADSLRSFHEDITADVARRGMGPERQMKKACDVFDSYGPELRGLLQGIAQTSGLSLAQTKILNAGMILLTQAVLGENPPDACSGIAAWGRYTPDGELVFGRNWDIDREVMRKYMTYLSVAVFHPREGSAFANIHPLGNVYVETGLNSHGVLVELNNAEQSDPSYYKDREDTSSVLLKVLTRAEDGEEAARMLLRAPADLSYTLQVADPQNAVAVERPTFDARIRSGRREGLLVAYNSFIPPYPNNWRDRIDPPPSPEQDPRYDNLVALASSDRFRGKLDPEAMMDLLRIPIENKGALHAGTVLQVVAVPETRTIWVRGVEYSDFQKVELSPLFAESSP